ncbi:hypothetical protein T484DRAFT_1923214, partial [Baffinella frigidus]
EIPGRGHVRTPRCGGQGSLSGVARRSGEGSRARVRRQTLNTHLCNGRDTGGFTRIR